ncbi:MAG: peptidylprolyl isomerase [Rhodocyclaceae bacterium]|nr:peptidylprolyl isomerase [Rhodocyclaceae bacterium]MBX3667462.1 peptidylprolyl isomerase [Rhodocyclaceae bacterium]
MFKPYVGALALALCNAALAANPQVEISTSMGPIVAVLYQDKAPGTVQNFLQYVKDGFYDKTIFHRVISGFMIQGGGFSTQFEEKATRGKIRNEANNGLKNETGTLAMARTPDPHSAGAQFFINLNDNEFLNFRAETPQGWGYAVFGKVVKGMEVVQKIGTVSTGRVGPYSDVPREAVVITSIKLLPETK